MRVGIPHRLLRWMQTPDGRLLRLLLTQPPVHVFVIPVGGTMPPFGFDRVLHAGHSREVFENWALYEEIEHRGRTRLCVRSAAGGEQIDEPLNVDDEPFKRSAGVPVGEPFELPADEDGRAEAAFQTLVAKVLRCDLYVTDTVHMVDLDGETGYRYPTETVTPEAAVPLLGLYLRGVGCYRLETDRHIGRRQPPPVPPIRSGEQTATFWHTAARSMLLVADDWQHLDHRISDPTKREEFSGFADSVLHRLEQLLRERDVLLRHLAVAPAGIGAGYLVGQSFDVILLLALAAVDAAAEAVNVVFELGVLRPSWRSTFLKKVHASCPGVVHLFMQESGGDHYATWKTLGELRNSIHSAAVSRNPANFAVHDYPGRVLLTIPPTRFAAVKRYLAGVDDLEHWGLYEGVRGSGQGYVHPGEFVEQLVPRVFALVQSVMAETLRGKRVPPSTTWGSRYGRPLSEGETQTLRMLGLERVVYGA